MGRMTSRPSTYEVRGSDISNALRGQPTVETILGKKTPIPGSGFTGIGVHGRGLLDNHSSTRIAAPELRQPELANFSSLLGRDILSIVGDNTGRHTVVGVNGRELPEPVKSLAGFQYIDVGNQGYAGAQGPQSGKLKEAMASVDPYYTSVLMGNQSGDFALHTGQTYGQLAKLAEVSRSDVPKVNDAIRNIGMSIKEKVILPDGSEKMVGRTVRPFTDFPSVEDPEALLKYINNLPTGAHRAAFLKGLDRAGFMKAGLPSVGDARLAVVDPAQVGMDWGTVGYRGFTPDLTRGTYKTTLDQSTTYDTGVDKIGNAQTFIPEGGQGIPASLVFRDFAEGQRAKGTGGGINMTSADYKVYEGSHKKAKQRGDNQLVETLDTFVEIERRFGREAAMRYGRDLLSGGKITNEMITAARKANAPSWMIAAMTPAAAGLLAMQPEQERY
jgi:hypothetical protein